MDLTSLDLLKLVQTAGVLGLAIFGLIAYSKGWIVPGQIYRDVCRDRDDWKEIALKGAGNMERAVSLAERRRLDAAQAD